MDLRNIRRISFNCILMFLLPLTFMKQNRYECFYSSAKQNLQQVPKMASENEKRKNLI